MDFRPASGRQGDYRQKRKENKREPFDPHVAHILTETGSSFKDRGTVHLNLTHRFC
jgi:hypothetical protein